MASTRRSSRINNASSSPPHDQASTQAGKKRKAESAASPKGHGKKAQKTLEQTMPELEKDNEPKKDLEMLDTAPESEPNKKQPDELEKSAARPVTGESAEIDTPKALMDKEKPSNKNGEHESEKESSKDDNEARKDGSQGNFVVKSPGRQQQEPSNIIEKGIIYFFTRGRVGVDDPESVQDLQRTYFVMRPIPAGAKLGEGANDDSKLNRLVALPKKVFPKSGRDRFMAFIEKGKASMDQLKEEVFKDTEYETKTQGTRHTNPITPVGEGVYAITEVGRSTHLAYMLTIPEKPEEVQEDLGLREKGSFIISLKNPTRKGPANASLPQKPDYPQEFIDDFRDLAWMPVHKAEYLNYPNAQLLLIGEDQSKFDSALEATEKDEKNDEKESPEEELEKLEDEDQIRIEHLHGEATVFDDLHISKRDYPSLRTTW